MKYCSHCGKKLDNRMMFCPECGSTIDVVTPPVVETTSAPLEVEKVSKISKEGGITTAKTSKKKIIPILCVVLLLVGLCIGGYFGVTWYFSDEQKLMRNLDSGNMDAALELVESNITLRVDENLVKALAKRIEDTKAAFAEGKLEYSEAGLEFDTIEKFKVKKIAEDLEQARVYVDELNQSRTCFATAEGFYADGEYVDAMEWYAKVIEEDSNYEAARAKHTESVNKYRDLKMAEAKEYAVSENYTAAIQLLNTALTVIPGDSIINEQIAVYEKANLDKVRNEALDTASQYAEDGDYAEAILVLLSAQKELPDDIQISAKLEAYRDAYATQVNQGLLEDAGEFVAKGDYASAILLLKNNTDAEVKTVYEAYCDEYEKLVLEEVDLLIANREYNEAILYLKDALEVLENHSVFVDKLAYLESIKPVSVLKLIEINRSDYWEEWNSGNPVDPFQNDYSHAVNYCIITCRSYKNYVEYRTYGKYDTISGTIAPYVDIGNDKSAYLQIYVDEELVYTSQTITRKTDAFDFTVDISGAEYVKVYVCTDDYYGGARVILSDVLVWP